MFRIALSVLLALVVAPSPSVAEPTAATSGAQAAASPKVSKSSPRVLFITADDCLRCDSELHRLRRPGGDFEKMRARGWKIGEGPENHVQIVHRDAVAELVAKLEVKEFPTVACVEGDQIVRSFKSGCTTPLDCWTFGFLATGVDHRPAGSVPEKAIVETTGHWPLRGNHWSIEEDWNPTKEKTIAHLRGPNHGSQIKPSWDIETWSHEELRSLHDDLHEQEMRGAGAASFATTSPRGATLNAGK